MDDLYGTECGGGEEAGYALLPAHTGAAGHLHHFDLTGQTEFV